MCGCLEVWVGVKVWVSGGLVVIQGVGSGGRTEAGVVARVGGAVRGLKGGVVRRGRLVDLLVVVMMVIV